MKNSKIIKILSVVLAAIVLVTSVTPNVVSAKKNTYSISGTWKRGKYVLKVDDKDMTAALYYKSDGYSTLYCWGIFEPWDTNKNKYSLNIGDNIGRYEFDAVVKKNKLEIKYIGEDDDEFKFLKGTWKRKK